MQCKHLNKHTEKTKWFPAQIIQSPGLRRWHDDGSTTWIHPDPTEILEKKATIITYCADCGELLQTVELKK